MKLLTHLLITALGVALGYLAVIVIATRYPIFMRLWSETK